MTLSVMLKGLGLIVFALAIQVTAQSPSGVTGGNMSVLFAGYADSPEELYHTRVLVESIRAFGGALALSRVQVYVPQELLAAKHPLIDSLNMLGAEVIGGETPDEALAFPYAAKVYAAAQCEASVADKTAVLVWMDEDTIVLQEPGEFALPEHVALAYRTVMHKNIGSMWAEPVNAFWQRVYDKLAISESSLFPMTTVASREEIRPYINAGLLVVRPERGLLRGWAQDFEKLYSDSVLVDMASKDRLTAIFLHQVALLGPILRSLRRTEMSELPFAYNYPLFFDKMFGAPAPFNSLDSVVTLRYDAYFRQPEVDWDKRLTGDVEKITWLKGRLGKVGLGKQPPGK